MLANKYRPYTFAGIVGQRNIVKNIQKQSMEDRFFSVYVLGGQFGSGKTTMARLVALAANCENKDREGNPCCTCHACRAIINGQAQDVLEVDGASNNGVEQVRNIIEQASYAPSLLKRRIFILDEVHMLSQAAWNALLKTLEEPSKSNIFILCTTETEKIPLTVMSRAAKYAFLKIEPEDIYKKLVEGAEKEKIEYEDEALMLIAKKAGGAMRNAWGLLEQASLAGRVTVGDISSLLMLNDSDFIRQVMSHILGCDAAAIIEDMQSFSMTGNSVGSLINDLSDLLSDMIRKDVSDPRKLENYCIIADSLMEAGRTASNSTITDLSVCFIRLSQRLGGSENVLLARIEELEKRIKALESGTRPVVAVTEEKTEPEQNADVVEEAAGEETVMTADSEVSASPFFMDFGFEFGMGLSFGSSGSNAPEVHPAGEPEKVHEADGQPEQPEEKKKEDSSREIKLLEFLDSEPLLRECITLASAREGNHIRTPFPAVVKIVKAYRDAKGLDITVEMQEGMKL